jgi:hypothetical protein
VFYPQITQISADFGRHVLPLRGNSRRRLFADWGRLAQIAGVSREGAKMGCVLSADYAD